jgi:hypothetical protein
MQDMRSRKKKPYHTHIRKTHKMSVSEYKEKYEAEVISPLEKNTIKNRMKGSNNPAFNHGGKLSPYSKNFVKYKDGSADYSMDEVIKKSNATKVENASNNTTIEYYLNKELSLEDAQKALSERQNNFTIEKCIERHGLDLGPKIWKNRQEKWQNTINSKPKHEIDQINAKKGNTREQLIEKYGEEKSKEILEKRYTKFGRSSKEAFTFFSKLYKKARKIGIKRGDIFLGTKKRNEYWIHQDSFFSYDFTIKSIKMIIEYHGTAFHPKAGDYNWKSPFGKTYDEMMLIEEAKEKAAIDKGFSYYVVWSDHDLNIKLNEMFSIIEEKFRNG